MKDSSVRPSRALSALFALALFFFILTVSIALPIYIRPFYYAHIDAMDLPQRSGFTAEEIREAYDQVLDYLTLPGREFGTGVMAHSPEGAAHFADCKFLFSLNAGILIASSLCLLVLLILRKNRKIGSLHAAALSGAAAAIILPVVIGGLAALDFDRAFVIFHTIFFPGKDNWIFDYRTDEIIRVLPQDFFMNCAILIGLGVLTLSTVIITVQLIRNRKTAS